MSLGKKGNSKMGNWPSADVTLNALHVERQRYDYPLFQRNAVWSETMNKSLIDTILRDLFIPAILAYREETPDGMKHWVIDGHNRIVAILEYIDGKYPTFSGSMKEQGERQYLTLEPKRYYWELSPSARAKFDAYTLRFEFLDGMPQDKMQLQFRRLQNQRSLTQAEKLWSHLGRATEVSRELEKHPLWEPLYRGNTKRKQIYQICLYLLFLQLSDGFANMTFPRLRDLAAGQKDNLMTPELIRTIQGHLDLIMHLFTGITIGRPEEIVPLYQSVLFLNEKYDLLHSERGCLSPWFGHIQLSTDGSGKHGVADTFGQLVYTGQQKDFWERELPKVSQVEGLAKKGKKKPILETVLPS